MTQTFARVLADSISNTGTRLSTIECTMGRSALAELNTHRDFSRNSASSRAIPVLTMLKQIREDPFIPRLFSVSAKGMSTTEYIAEGDERYPATLAWWLKSRDRAMESAEEGIVLGVHKQDVNRILEAWMWHTVIISSTRWDNFLKLRTATHDNGTPAVYPPFYDAAVAIRDALAASSPARLQIGEWHLPLIDDEDRKLFNLGDQIRLSTSRCAAVSYNKHHTQDYATDIKRYDILANAGHYSPFEHPARGSHDEKDWANFTGWKQARRYLELGQALPR